MFPNPGDPSQSPPPIDRTRQAPPRPAPTPAPRPKPNRNKPKRKRKPQSTAWQGAGGGGSLRVPAHMKKGAMWEKMHNRAVMARRRARYAYQGKP